MENEMQKTYMPTVAGVLEIVAGVLGILAFICWFFLLPFLAVLLIMMGLGGFLP